jgi:hypothetical protein
VTRSLDKTFCSYTSPRALARDLKCQIFALVSFRLSLARHEKNVIRGAKPIRTGST